MKIFIKLCRKHHEIGDKVSIQEKYYISDLKLTGEKFARVIKGYRSIENNLH